LSKDEIEEMVANAERYKSEDDLVRKRVEAKNGLESYTYNVKNSTTDEKLADKFEPEDKTALEAKIAETLQWLEGNSEA
jgi:heat shock protein 1/8